MTDQKSDSRHVSQQVFNKFVREVENHNYIDILEKSENIYAVRQFKIGHLSPLMVTQIYHNIYQKFNRNFIPRFELNWWENELRIFVWVLVLYVEIRKTQIENLNADDWQFFMNIFPHKKQILFEYQSINILKEHGQAKKWIPEQDQLFRKLVNQKGLKCKWSELAKILYIQSEKLYFRTPKQCRQRWLNHLDPSKCKADWESKEDYILIHYVLSKGKKWAQISKLLKNKRNQHSIKNRFKSLITKQEKFHREKLEESELIECIFKRYDTKFNFLLSKPAENQDNLKNEHNSQQIKSQKNQSQINFSQINSSAQLRQYGSFQNLEMNYKDSGSVLSASNGYNGFHGHNNGHNSNGRYFQKQEKIGRFTPFIYDSKNVSNPQKQLQGGAFLRTNQKINPPLNTLSNINSDFYNQRFKSEQMIMSNSQRFQMGNKRPNTFIHHSNIQSSGLIGTGIEQNCQNNVSEKYGLSGIFDKIDEARNKLLDPYYSNYQGVHSQQMSLENNEPSWIGGSFSALPEDVDVDEDRLMSANGLYRHQSFSGNHQLSFQNEPFHSHNSMIFKNFEEQMPRQQVIDEKEKVIRAQIFLAEDPFDLLKPYFMKKAKTQNPPQESSISAQIK